MTESSKYEIKYRDKRQAGLMPVLFLVAAAKAVFGGGFLAGTLVKGAKYGGGGRGWSNMPPGEYYKSLLLFSNMMIIQ